MRIAVTLFCIMLYFPVAGQSILNEKIAGEWICEEVTFLDEKMVDKTNTYSDVEIKKITSEAFTNASFQFGTNGIFHLKYPPVKNQITEGFSILNGQTWDLNPKTLMIYIGAKANLMGIQVREVGSVVTFQIAETPIVLKMKKVDPKVKRS